MISKYVIILTFIMRILLTFILNRWVITFFLAPCQTVSYDVRVSKFNQGPIRVWFPEPEEEVYYDISSDYEEKLCVEIIFHQILVSSVP